MVILSLSGVLANLKGAEKKHLPKRSFERPLPRMSPSPLLCRVLIFHGVLSPLRRYHAKWGIAAIASQCHVIWGLCLEAPCGWEFNRGRGHGWESRPLSRFCFALVLHYNTTIGRLSLLCGLERGSWKLLPVRGCEIGPPNRTPYRRGGPIAVEGVKQR